MSKNLIVGLIVVSLVILLGGCMVSVNNRAVVMEETVEQVMSDVTIQEKRRVTLILNLVEVVEQSANYEKGTLIGVTEMRRLENGEGVEEALNAINVAVEAYPSLKAVDNYNQLMTELSVTENMVSEYRQTVNDQVQIYRSFVRKFPNSMFLNIMGHEVVDYSYLQFEDTTMPDSLFGN